MQPIQQNTEIHNKIIGIMNNPPVSKYDYFTEFKKDPLCFTEGVKAMIEATDSLWAILEICRAQRINGLNSIQAWVLSSFSVSGIPTLKGFNADVVLINQMLCTEFSGKAFSDTAPILKKSNYDKCFPIKGEVWFWVANDLIMLPKEYEGRLADYEKKPCL